MREGVFSKRLSGILGVQLDSYDENLADRSVRFSALLKDGTAICMAQIEEIRSALRAKDLSFTVKADARYADQGELMTLVTVDVSGVTFILRTDKPRRIG